MGGGEVGIGGVTRVFHGDTSHVPGRWPEPDVAGFVPMDPRNRPAPFKRYPHASVHLLPATLPPRGAPAAMALSGRMPLAHEIVDVAVLARLLFFSAGITRTATAQGRAIWFRAAPSAGNLHPVELYAVTGPIDGLPTGVYHFAPEVFGLEQLCDGDRRPVIADALVAPDARASPLVLIVTGIPWRTAWKYGERGWRHVYWDAGTLLANLLALTDAYGLPANLLLGFVDAALCRTLGVDGRAEFPVAAITVGHPQPPPAIAARRATRPAPAITLSPPPVEFPLSTAVQQAGNLTTAEQVAAWRAAAPEGLPRTQHIPNPPATARAEPIESVILRRGSTRRMRRGLVPTELLHWGMAVASRHVPADAIPAHASLLNHELAVHAVHGVRPGLYHWIEGVPRPHRAMPESVVRRLSRHLCLDQPLGGDSAYTDFTCCALERVLGAYGDRGYRLAQLEAGVAAGRLQLAAFTLGHGGTGLTFFDDEVSAAFAVRAAPMLAVSIGIPAYRPKPGGPPRHPTELSW